ncbi:hypothetical protein SNE40_007623 [Patella caerulea]|uniref:FAD dependent oxidoreductase domain-containing protein n=1 Tax=Patella caerulea TaxID=87958 RepID=A0AAN8K3Y2_PATCE
MFLYHAKEHDYYQIPIHGNSCSKIGVDAGGPPVTGNTRNFIVDPVREEKCVSLMQSLAPKFVGPIMYTKTCLYTMTPDRHFVIDKCDKEGWSDVIFCCGAGHAFKFACLLGKIMSEMAIDGKTQYDIAGFTRYREAITDPNYPNDFQWGKQIAEQAADRAKL